MSVPSSQVAALWVKAEIVSVEWTPLDEVCFTAITNKWAGKSEEEVWDYIEKNIPFIAEHLRDEASVCLVDGSAPKFLIDEEQPPYVKSVGAPTSELLSHLRLIDPFKVEEICAEILKGFGAAAQATQRTADGGVDFIAANLNIVPEAFAVPTGCRATIIGQTKRYKDGNAITEKMMREFVGAGLLRKHVLQADGRIAPLTPVIFAFWTTSDFEPNAKKYARDVGLWFMDGHTLATYIHSLGLGDMVMELPTLASTAGTIQPGTTAPPPALEIDFLEGDSPFATDAGRGIG